MKVLVVDDEPEILKKIVILCESHGHTVRSASSIDSLRTVLRTRSFYPQAVILDRILNDCDSLTVLSEIKRVFADTRVLVLSAIDMASEKAQALNEGADDYLAKPFSSLELMARINALVRRSTLYGESENLEIKNLRINRLDHTVRVNAGDDISVTQKEYQLLLLFCSHPGKIFPRDFILQEVWKNSIEQESKVVEATINNLRRKLETQKVDVKIKNMRNVGYWFEA